MPVTKDQAHMLAALATACRPHGAPHWDEPGIVAAIGKVAHLSLADVALAVIRAASDRDAKTPGVIASTKSIHWRERIIEAEAKQTYRPPRADEVCPIHLAGYADTCPGCRADQLAGDTTPSDRRRAPATPTPEYLAARAALDRPQ